MLDPNDYPLKNAGRDVPLQCCLTASASNVPCCVTSHEAAGNGHRRKQPGISVVRDEPQQQQIGAAGYGQGDHRGINDGDREKPQRTQVREPVGHQGVVCSRDGGVWRQWSEGDHLRVGCNLQEDHPKAFKGFPCSSHLLACIRPPGPPGI